MSYNPVRAQGRTARRRPASNPHAGVKHSDIVRTRGVGSSLPPLSARESSEHGFGVPVFAGSDFVVRHEVMYQGNNSGIGVNEEADRIILVRRGLLFLTIDAG